MRLLIALLPIILLVAACGGDSSPTPSAIPSPTATTPASSRTATSTVIATPPTDTSHPTFSGHVCDVSHLSATLLPGGVAAGTDYFRVAIRDFYPASCILGSDPTILFEDAAGTPIPYAPSSGSLPCGATDTDFTACIHRGAIELSGTAESADTLAVPEAIVVIGIANTSYYDPVPTPTHQARSIGFKFPDMAAFIVHLDGAITLIPSGQVHIQGYGPYEPPACSIDQLAGLFMDTQGAAGTEYADFAIGNVGTTDCSLPGPPDLQLEDADGNAVGTAGGPSSHLEPCTPGTTCVRRTSFVLVPNGPLPLIPVKGARITINTLSPGLAPPPCDSPRPVAAALVVGFSGISGTLRIPFGAGPHDQFVVGPCAPQFSLIGWPDLN